MSTTLLSSENRENLTEFNGAVPPGASDTETATDLELVQRFNTGDEAAFVEIVHRHQGKIFQIILALLENHADAEEVTQDTFIRAHRGLGRFRGDSSLATWLRHVARNLAHNRYWYYFRRRRQDTVPFDSPFGNDPSDTFAEHIATDAPGPSHAATLNELSTILADCMGKLQTHHRDILISRNVLDHSYDEIARGLHIKVITVKSRISRARGNLRALLVETCPELSPDLPGSEWFEPARAEGGMMVA